MQTHDDPTLGWTVVLRRQPVHLREGRPEGGYTDDYELVCCDCGDDPDLDFRDVSPRLQRIRGPYGFRQASRRTGSTSGFSMGSGERPRSPMMGDVGDAKCCEPSQWLRRQRHSRLPIEQ